jgi:hypothetical protein
VLAALVHAEQRRDDQVIGVGFGDHEAAQAASYAIKRAHDADQARPDQARPEQPQAEQPQADPAQSR